MRRQNSTLEIKAILCVVIVVISFHLLPFIIFGTDSIVRIHDNVDNGITNYKMLANNRLFLAFDAPTKGFSEMSTLYYGHGNFSIIPLLYNIFDDFFAYTLSHFFSFLLGFFSMYFLLKEIKIKINPTISILISTCFAILPAAPVIVMASNTWPLIIAVFLHFARKTRFSWTIIWVLFYPLVSSFTLTGIFILCFWFLCLFVLWYKNKRINMNLLAGFLLLCVGFILVDLRLFYVMFILKTPLNRSIFFPPDESISYFKFLLIRLAKFCVNGFYHAFSLQRLIIIPVASLLSIFFLNKLFRNIRRQKYSFVSRIKAGWTETDHRIKFILTLEFVIFTFYCITALYDSKLIELSVAKVIPLLRGFNWGRLWVLNRVLWYVLFAVCLQYIWEIKTDTVKVKIGRLVKNIKLSPCFFRKIVWGLLILQINYIMLKPVAYNDPVKTWFNELIVKTGVAMKILPHKDYGGYFSYKEFFAEDLFTIIKKDISYSNERVVAFGFHPSVLMYNGFNCIDGYNNAYPLSYMQKFRKLIEPELEVNQEAKKNYDAWGGRMYLYSTELDFDPTRNKNTVPVKLNIDMNVFRNDFEGKYILSRAVISNSDALGLKLVKQYDYEGAIYTIYLYEVNYIGPDNG